ncbi:MAG: hypothetical protein ABTQ31_13330 [Rhizobiaceae bacterium]
MMVFVPLARQDDRISKFAFARLIQKATTVAARTFLDELVEAVPYKSTPTTASS